MNGNKLTKQFLTKYNTKFFEDVTPTKLTEGKKVKLHSTGWGILSEYYLESAKITRLKTGEVHSAATLKISDRSGQTVCLVKGHSVGLLFGLTPEEWSQIESLCGQRQQLFYRYFKDGLSPNYSYEQKLFYHFCLTNQKNDVLLAIFKRRVNVRNRDKNDAFLEIIELTKCDGCILDMYISYIRNEITVNSEH